MEDYDSCCRLCLSSHPDNQELFGPICLQDLIPQKILCILSILVHPQDSLPQQICPHCLENVKRFYKFHRTSSCSTAHLLTFLEKDDDVSKNVYANMLKNFQKKNYSCLAGESNYQLLIQEKFDEVKNSVYDVTSRFSNAKLLSNCVQSEVQKRCFARKENPASYLLEPERNNVNAAIPHLSDPNQKQSAVSSGFITNADVTLTSKNTQEIKSWKNTSKKLSTNTNLPTSKNDNKVLPATKENKTARNVCVRSKKGLPNIKIQPTKTKIESLKIFRSLVEENVDIKPKDQFLSGLDLKQNNVGNCEPCALDIETILKDYDLDNSQQDSQGIFELTDMAKYSTQDSHIWQISEQIRPKVPLVVTIDSDDD
ncbi:hypothetical protein M8J77_007706 [Diaphorina citri]|nr:hypothetical protein M8J77_007706 [Diaphorina citri]